MRFLPRRLICSTVAALTLGLGSLSNLPGVTPAAGAAPQPDWNIPSGQQGGAQATSGWGSRSGAQSSGAQAASRTAPGTCPPMMPGGPGACSQSPATTSTSPVPPTTQAAQLSGWGSAPSAQPSGTQAASSSTGQQGGWQQDWHIPTGQQGGWGSAHNGPLPGGTSTAHHVVRVGQGTTWTDRVLSAATAASDWADQMAAPLNMTVPESPISLQQALQQALAPWDDWTSLNRWDTRSDRPGSSSNSPAGGGWNQAGPSSGGCPHWISGASCQR